MSTTFSALGLLQRASEGNIPEESFKMLRRNDGAVNQLVEMWLLVVGIRIPTELRSHYLFQASLEACAGFCAAANELVGIGKDLQNVDGDSNSLILNRVLHIERLTLEEAYSQRGQDAANEFAHFIYCSKELRKSYAEKSLELDAVLLMLGVIIDTHGHLLSHVERYQDTKIEVVPIKTPQFI
jgi:hypothetical protein